MAGALSGRFGVVNGVSTVRNWSINHISTPQKFVASNTKGGAGRRHGVQDFNGSFGGYGYAPPVMPGEGFSFSGLTAPTTGVEASSGQLWNGTAIVDSVAVTYSWAAAEIVSWVLNFSANGALTNTDGAIADVLEPTVPQVCGSEIEIESAPILDVVSAVLTLTAENQAYVNSSSVISGKCWTKRRRGNLDWTLAIVQQDDEPFAHAIGEDLEVTLPGGWALNWAHYESLSNLLVDRETGAIISRTLNFSMNGFVGGDVGQILVPGGDQLWPIPSA
jgi:hypothetical protein